MTATFGTTDVETWLMVQGDPDIFSRVDQVVRVAGPVDPGERLGLAAQVRVK